MKLLILTDHSRHSSENSLYALVRALAVQLEMTQIRVASRGTAANRNFFSCRSDAQGQPVQTHLRALLADQEFAREAAAQAFDGDPAALVDTPLAWPDVVFLRIPHPVPEQWFGFITRSFGDKPIFNRPAGVALTTSKAWLLNVTELCAPLRLCQQPQELLEWVQPDAGAAPRDVVLKPLNGYGGQGIIRIINGLVELPAGAISIADWPSHPVAQQPYLAMDFLPGVAEGDKRIVVVDGHIMGAVLRLPARGEWLCNIAQGGRATAAEVDADEQNIIHTLDPLMRQLGVVMYGVDTLLGNEGKRVLSEVNTMSIGGLLDLPLNDGRSAVSSIAQHLARAFQASLS